MVAVRSATMSMEENLIRIVVSTPTTAFKRDSTGALHMISRPMIYQKGRTLPPPEGEPEDPLVIVDILEFEADEETGEEAYFGIYSVGADGTPAAVADVGFVTRIPASLVIRKDARVSASDMIEALQGPAEEEPTTEAVAVAPVPTPAGWVMPPQQAAQAPVQAPPLPPEVAVMPPQGPGLMGTQSQEVADASDDRH